MRIEHFVDNPQVRLSRRVRNERAVLEADVRELTTGAVCAALSGAPPFKEN